jgi:hypothetical protein
MHNPQEACMRHLLFPWAVCAALLLPPPLDAEWRLYDKQRDALAQRAQREAEGLRSGAVFERQARNLRALSERDSAAVLESARLRMRGNIASFRTWSDVTFVVTTAAGRIKRQEPPDLPKASADLDAQRKGLQAEIAALKPLVTEDALQNVMNNIGDVSDALAAAQKLLDAKDQAGLTTATGVLQQLEALYGDYRTQLATVDKVATQLNNLKIDVKRALLSRLKVEEEILVSRLALYERRERELDLIRLQVTNFRLPTGVTPDDRIEASLASMATDRARLERAVRDLYIAASIAARAEVPEDLYQVRVAQLEHLRSIRISAANARVYEAVLGGGVQRLALFYQGGARPETLAQVLQSLATAGIFGKLLTQ